MKEEHAQERTRAGMMGEFVRERKRDRVLRESARE